MLQNIREKSQGVFAWVILLMICIPFALWGIQNYLGGGTEAPIASVGDKEFYQQDLNRAYAQYAQNLGGMKFDEEMVKQQAFEKLIRDEVLLQYVQASGLTVTDETARNYIQSLDYFQTDGKFDKKQYKSLLGSQRMSSAEFVGRIKKALVMEQFQKAIIDSGFVTEKEVERFFAIQNQTRDIEYITVPLKTVSEQPGNEEIEAYYRQHQDEFQTPEQVSVEFVELSLDALADEVEVDEEKLKAFYEERKDQYTTKGRRKISHILFKFDENEDDDGKALERAMQAKRQLQEKDFETLAKELSDDKLTARNGGDLGLFNEGVMEKAFEEAALGLELGQVSEPVKSAFGYHLIKVTELVPGDVKSFEAVKDEITTAYKRAQAETRFFEMGETMADVGFENPDSLTAVADALGIAVNKSALFSRSGGEGIAFEQAVRDAAFSEEVLKGNNSEPVEIGSDRLVMLRLLEHKTAATRPLEEVKSAIANALQNEKASKQTADTAEELKKSLLGGETVAEAAEKHQLKAEKIIGLTRNGNQLSPTVLQAVFKAAKPVGQQPTVIVAPGVDGSQTVVSLFGVTEGVMSESDKQKMELATRNLANAYGQSMFGSVMADLENQADISVHKANR